MPFTFAVLRNGGLASFVETAATASGLTADQLSSARRPSLAFTRANVLLDNYLSGNLVPQAETSAGLRSLASVFNAIANAVDASADLVDANPGHIVSTIRAEGGQTTIRSFD